MNELGRRLTEERERLGSLRAAARAMKVAPGTYEGWEKGWRRPLPGHYVKIATFFGEPDFVILGWLGYLTKEQVAELIEATGLYLGSIGSAIPRSVDLIAS